ncbi:MAG TPA: sigma-70 family RNA polymerase sigma factor [Chloroflexota bacterium]|nr:sigma-70 family RNA polymerase sigma factor [Chloroflexota bacterium]
MAPEPSDESLVARVVERDPAALGQLYDRYAPGIYAMAAHLLGSSDAEEVVQEVFLRLWHKAAQFDPGRSAFGAWFMAVARHHILDELRWRNHHAGQHAYVAGTEAIEQLLARAADPGVDVEAEAERQERGAAVRQALTLLPPEQRRVLVLAYFGGLSQSAIAAHLGCPLGTVKKRMRLGMQKLRTHLLSVPAAQPEGTAHPDRRPEPAPAPGVRDAAGSDAGHQDHAASGPPTAAVEGIKPAPAR